jgi:hypothetical protein
MFNGGLVLCSMCLGVPFIALRQLGTVWAPFGRHWLPSVRGRTRQSGAPPDSEQCAISFLFLRSWPLPAMGHVAHWTVRCHLLTVGWAMCHPLIARLTVGCARGWHTRQSGVHRTVRWIIAAAPSVFSQERHVCQGASLGTGHCPVHRRLVQVWLDLAKRLQSDFSRFDKVLSTY